MKPVSLPTQDIEYKEADLFRMLEMPIPELTPKAGTMGTFNTGAILLKQPNLRFVLWKIDLLLKIGGDLLVTCGDTTDTPKRGRRTGTQVQYELSCVFPDCYKMLSNKNGLLVIRKMKEGRAWQTAIPCFTLGYITDGRDMKMLRRTLQELPDLRSHACVREVLLAGPKDKVRELLVEFPQVKWVGDYTHDDARAPINRKKALIIDAAECENLILAHDRFYLDNHFWQRLTAFGNYFDFYNCRHCSVDSLSSEIEVTGSYGYHKNPISGYSAEFRSGTAKKSSSNPHFYNNGGIYIGKTAWFRAGRWPLHLHWSDLEDVHFTRRCELDGATWSHDWCNRVFTTTKRMSPLKRRRLDQIVRGTLTSLLKGGSFYLSNGEAEIA